MPQCKKASAREKTQHTPYSALGTQDLFGFRLIRKGHQNLKYKLLAKPLRDSKHYGRLYYLPMHPRQSVHHCFCFFSITFLIQLSMDITQIHQHVGCVQISPRE